VKVGAIIKLIEDDGWQQVATRGSHRQYRHPGKPSDELHPKTQASILRQAGLRR